MKRLFSSINPSYLYRAYAIGCAIAGLFLWTSWSRSPSASEIAIFTGFAVVSTILFPFAKLVWDELKRLILGEGFVLWMSGWAFIVTLAFRLIINVMIWAFALVIAPLGIAYLWFSNRAPEAE